MPSIDPSERSPKLVSADIDRVAVKPVITDVEGAPYISPRPVAEFFVQASDSDKKIDTLNKILAAVSEISFKKEEYPGGDTLYRASFIFDNPALSESEVEWNFNNHAERNDFMTVYDALGDLFMSKNIVANMMREPDYNSSQEIGYRAQRISFMIPGTLTGSIAEAYGLVTSLLEAKEKLGDLPE